jgi:DNA helicase-2/ATP-dependent DNA helicase PcrA
VLTFLLEFARQEIHDPVQVEAVQLLIQRVITEANADTLEKVLRALGVSLGSSEQERSPREITIMTMHQAKGLEADAVIVMAAEKEFLPGAKRGREADDERRLLYVSLSRARDYLFVTYSCSRTGRQRHSGSNAGESERHLTDYLSGGPIRPQPGESYLQSLRPLAQVP